MVRIKGSVTGSVGVARAGAKQKGQHTKRIPKEGLIVRVLTEPDEWFGPFPEHYLEGYGYFPCIEGNCLGCEQDHRPSQRYAISVFDRDTSKVETLIIPMDVANRLMAKYDKAGGTLKDRDYELSKMGSGKENTTYDVDAEERSKFNFVRNKPSDIETDLTKAWKEVFSDGGDEDDDRPRKGRRTSTTSKKRSAKKKASSTAGRRRVRR